MRVILDLAFNKHDHCIDFAHLNPQCDIKRLILVNILLLQMLNLQTL